MSTRERVIECHVECSYCACDPYHIFMYNGNIVGRIKKWAPETTTALVLVGERHFESPH